LKTIKALKLLVPKLGSLFDAIEKLREEFRFILSIQGIEFREFNGRHI